MSNLGLEHALAKEGIEFRRAKVGDRYVLEMLKESGGMLGGETSGHLLCLDRTTTGDALISALQVLAIMKETRTKPRGAGRADAEVSAGAGEREGRADASIRPSRRRSRKPWRGPKAGSASSGRIVLRPSGTEPVIRVMVEGSDDKLVREIAKELAASVALAAQAAA